MPRTRPEDNLLLMAATAILILTAQHFFQAGTRARSEGLAAAPAGSLPHEYKARSDSPPAVRRANWKSILWRIYERSNDDRLLATAGGVVFFGLLAVFPAVTALVSSYGLFADPSTIGANLQTLALMLPEGSFQIVQDQIARVIDQGNAALGGTFLFGLALALWSANAGVKAIIDALNVVYEVRETRNFLKLNLLSLAFTTGGIVALLLMVSAVVAFPLLFSHLGLPPESGFILGLARWPLLLAVLMVALSLLEMVLSMFSADIGLFDGGAMGLLFAVAGLVLGVFMLILDFDFAEQLIAHGAPEREAWRVAFGLTVSLVWIYTNLLRILAILNSD